MTEKRKEQILETALNTVIFMIRLAFFLYFPAVFSTAFAGMKYIVQQISARAPFECKGK